MYEPPISSFHLTLVRSIEENFAFSHCLSLVPHTKSAACFQFLQIVYTVYFVHIPQIPQIPQIVYTGGPLNNTPPVKGGGRVGLAVAVAQGGGMAWAWSGRRNGRVSDDDQCLRAVQRIVVQHGRGASEHVRVG